MLIAVIELAVFINLGLPHYLGQSLPFIAPICIIDHSAGRDRGLRHPDDHALQGGARVAAEPSATP